LLAELQEYRDLAVCAVHSTYGCPVAEMFAQTLEVTAELHGSPERVEWFLGSIGVK
jgi:hypothetical protein